MFDVVKHLATRGKLADNDTHTAFFLAVLIARNCALFVIDDFDDVRVHELPLDFDFSLKLVSNGGALQLDDLGCVRLAGLLGQFDYSA